LKIGLVIKNESAEALKLAEKVEKVLAKNSCESIRIKSGAKLDKLDVIFVFGGDGTLLYAASLVGEKGIPILGVKIGGLGFLTEVKEQELFDMIEKAVCANLQTEDRMLLKAEVVGGEDYLALNDIVIGKAVLDRMVDIDIKIDGYELTRIRADGLIVSTPTGSTAYCLAANGPIVHPHVFAMIVVPICAHSLTLRPLVVPADSKISIKVNTKGGDTHLIADGKLGRKIKDADVIKISRGKKPLRLVNSPTMNYYEILRTKLGWGWK
jgi:NAD+ kinase